MRLIRPGLTVLALALVALMNVPALAQTFRPKSQTGTSGESGPARAQTNDLAALSNQVVQLYRQRRYAEATPIAQRMLTLAERIFGKD